MDRAEGIKPSYLLGTMHLPDKDIVELPPHIDSVVARADSLSIEVKLNNDAFRAMADLSALNGSETLSDLIGEKEFAAVLAVLKDRGLTQYALERLKPWAAALIMNYPPPSLDPILDYALQLRFKNNNKPVYQLETAREQIQIFNQMAVSDQIKFLRYSLQQQAMFDVYLAQMKALYLADDLDGLENLTKQQMIHSDKKFMSLLLNELIDKRNLRMVDRMQQYLQKGNALIAIGALHLTGEYGVLQLLSEIGYRVSPVLGKD
ncbi:MAG: TraB/GumN family protein [Pseudomonadales bacterium]|nr:TraB/GumN family protein [Pseudomonadales bacterium]